MVEANKPFFNDIITQQIIVALIKDAKSSERNKNNKKAINAYKAILALNKKNSEAENAVNRLLNEVTTIFTVAEISNTSDEILSTSSDKILKLIKDKLEDKYKYIEVARVKDFLAEEQAVDLEFDNIAQLKDIKFKPARKVRYVILPKVIALKINRTGPNTVTKSANWDYSVDGNAFGIGAQESLNYGGATINYYEYTEGTERVNATQRIEFAVFDTLTNKVVLKTRVDARKDESAVWAENPMAVGVRNKVPASFYPNSIRRLMANSHSVTSDEWLKNSLMEDTVAQMIQKIKEKFSM